MIGTVALTTASNGTVKIRLKKLKLGKHKLKVTYLGTCRRCRRRPRG